MVILKNGIFNGMNAYFDKLWFFLCFDWEKYLDSIYLWFLKKINGGWKFVLKMLKIVI